MSIFITLHFKKLMSDASNVKKEADNPSSNGIKKDVMDREKLQAIPKDQVEEKNYVVTDKPQSEIINNKSNKKKVRAKENVKKLDKKSDKKKNNKDKSGEKCNKIKQKKSDSESNDEKHEEEDKEEEEEDKSEDDNDDEFFPKD